jgi:hypothetical protein
VGEKTRKAPLPPPEGRRGERRPGKEFERSFGGRETERERDRERDGEESAWRERKEGRIKKERGDFECE